MINGDCRTSDESIYAIGECAAYEGRVFGLVAPGYQMARIAAARVLGTEGEVFAGADMSTKLKLLGVDVGSIGDAHARPAGARVYSFFDQRSEVYKKLVVDAEGKKLIGAVLVGDTSDYSHVAPDGRECDATAGKPGDHAVSGERRRSAGAPPANALAALPDNSADLLVQQRLEGRRCARPSRRAARRSARSRPRPRPAPPAAAARRWSRRCSTPSSRSAA